MEAAFISAAAAVLVAAVTAFLTKYKEREAAWRAKKLSYYEEFVAAVSGTVGQPPPEAKIRFANAVNNLHLIGSQDVIDTLHNYCDEISESNPERSIEKQNNAWSALVWHIRADIGDRPAKLVGNFEARLWNSGVGSNATR